MRALRSVLFLLCAALLCNSGEAFAQLSFNATTYPVNSTGPGALALTTGDFNNDGWPDYAVLVGNSTVQIFLNDHTGHFTAGPTLSTPEQEGIIAAADLNGDGRQDLVLADSQSSQVEVWFGDGTGQFHAGPILAAPLNVNSLVIADFDSDGKLDLATAENDSAATTYMLNFYHGNGDGTFAAASVLGTYAVPVSGLAAIDFNRDGHVDLASTAMHPSRALVFYGDGAGGFPNRIEVNVSNPIPANAAESGPEVAAGDFDEDGTPDIALSTGYICGSACGQTTVHILHSNAAADSFTEISSFVGMRNDSPGTMEVGDLNGDLHQDLLVWNSSHYGGGVWSFLNDGTGHFTQTSNSSLGTEVGGVTIRDFNLDSGKDVGISDWMGNAVYILLNSGFTFNCSAAGGTPGGINARVCNPVNGQTVPAGSPVTVQAAGNSPDGVARMELWIDGAKQYETWNDQLKHDITLSAGTHTLALVAVDRLLGYSSTKVTVNASTTATDQPPVAKLSVSPTSGPAPLIVTANMTASYDPDGTIASTVINWGDNTANSGPTSQHMYTNPGTYTITGTAWDNAGLGSTVTQTVTVTASTAATVIPQSGYWWDPNLNGEGYDIQYGGNSGNGVFITAFTYNPAGNPTWVASTGQYDQATSSYSGTWLAFTGGQTLTGPYQAPTSKPGGAGHVSIAWSDATHAVMMRPDGTQINLVPFSFTPNSTTPAPPQPGSPQNGYWWAGPSYSGSGYAIQIQGSSIFALAYVYDSSGMPIWYLASGQMSTPTTFSGTWDVYAGGPQMDAPEGTYHAHYVSTVTPMSLTFSDATHGTLTMGNVSIPIVPFESF